VCCPAGEQEAKLIVAEATSRSEAGLFALLLTAAAGSSGQASDAAG